MNKQISSAVRSMEQAKRTLDILLPQKEIRRISSMLTEASKSMRPVIEIMQSPSFQRRLHEIQAAQETVRIVAEKAHSINLPVLKAMSDLYGVTTRVADEIADKDGVSDADKLQVVTTPLARELHPKDIRLGNIKLPDDITWEDIDLQFTDGHTAILRISKYKIETLVTYENLGMADGRSKNKPNAQWFVLHNLAEYNGEINWQTPVASNGLKKQKQLLSAKLKKCFGIKSDPFGVYQNEKAYRIKMNLIPENSLMSANTDIIGTQEYISEQCPSIYEKES